MENNTNTNYQQAVPQQYPQAAYTPRKPRKNTFLTFFCALFPGCGQMYHGLLKKGLSVMLLFWGIIAVSAFLYIGEICLVLPVIWFYSFFDTVNRMNMPIDEMKLLKDDYLFIQTKTQQDGIFSKLFDKRHLIIGWGLVFIGVFAIMNSYTVTDGIATLFNLDFSEVRYIMNMIPGIVIPVACVILGIYLLVSSFKKQKSSSVLTGLDEVSEK